MGSFDDFWAAYPRKVGKGAALEKYKAALNKGVTPEEIEAALERNKDEWVKEMTPTKYIPHPGTWMHQKRYLNHRADKPQKELTLSPAERIQILLRDEPPPVPKKTEEQKARARELMGMFKRGVPIEQS
jgi:hypothetical protein